MILYVESNFVLELAWEQEQFDAANGLLTLAEGHKFQLAFPAMAITEPFSLMTYRRMERGSFRAGIKRQLTQIKRSVANSEVESQLSDCVVMLERLDEQETRSLQVVAGRLLAVGRSIPMTAEIFQLARHFEDSHDMDFKDAIIYASIYRDLADRQGSETTIFASRDVKAFADLKRELLTRGCRFLSSFEAARAAMAAA